MYIIYFSQVIVRALDKKGGLYECFFGDCGGGSMWLVFWEIVVY